MKINIEPIILQFKRPSGTSRGVLLTKPSWILTTLLPNGHMARGECSVIPGLSPDFESPFAYEQTLESLKAQMEKNWTFEAFSINNLFKSEKWLTFTEEFRSFPSILFGIETLALDIQNGGTGVFFDTAFTQRKAQIPINGLVWMGDIKSMQTQIDEKLMDGFTTLKLKIGAIDWKQELDLLKKLRKKFSPQDLTIRVDANGSFQPANVMEILNDLGELSIHSIEQPISVKQWNDMRKLCEKTPVAIALDEELIGLHRTAEKQDLLAKISPQYIVLKPSLHGGITGCVEWIQLAEANGTGWWMTSALESSIGLNAIAQFTSTFPIELPQGLGTGELYTNNFDSLLVVQNGFLKMRP